MKKVGLLLFALASCYAGAFAGDAYYLIKDGKLQNGVQYTPFESESEENNELKEGDGYMYITHHGDYTGYLETRLTGMQGLTVGTKRLVIDYMVDEKDIRNESSIANKTCENPEKATIIIECMTEEDAGFVIEMNKGKNVISRTFIDGKQPGNETKWNNFAEYTFALRDREVKSVLIAYKREVAKDTESELKIKNLYFETDENNIPIYGCQFDGTNIWTEKFYLTNLVDSLYFQNGIALNWTQDPDYIVEDKGAFLALQFDKSDSGDIWWDGSNIPMTQMYAALTIVSQEFLGEPLSYSIWTDPIQLPEDAIKAGKIKVDCYAKKYDKDQSYALEGRVNGLNEKELLPIYVKFDTGDSVNVFPDSMIYDFWTHEVGEVNIPKNAKSFSVDFKQNPLVSYMVDKLVVSYKGSVGVAKVNSDGKSLSIYPNPVLNEIAFYGIEDIQSVEIVSLNGAVKACTVVDNKVNVSGLAAGEYAIIVNKNITGKFIKK